MEPSQRRLVAGLAGGLACALLVIAFLLGRLSAQAPAVGAPEGKRLPESPEVTAAVPSPSAPPVDAVTLGSPAPTAEAEWREEAKAPSATPRVLVTPPAADPRSITAYFEQVDALDNVGAGDPQEFAKSLLASMTSGDFSGFDDLLAQARRQQERLRSISPPASCRDHHRLALALSGESVAMLETLSTSLARGDTSALMAMAERAQKLEAQTNELKAMAAEIRRQAGA